MNNPVAASSKPWATFWIAESLTNLSSEILSFSTVYFRFSVIGGEIMMNIFWFFQKTPMLATFGDIMNHSGNTENLNVLILIILIFEYFHFWLSKITQPWWLANFEYWFQKFEGEIWTNSLTISLLETAVLRRFQWYLYQLYWT